jgi:hypothetical protein
LNKCRIKYAFTGAFALSYYGHPRSSMDLDILVERNDKRLMNFVSLLKNEGFSISEDDVNRAVGECSHFAVFYKSYFPYFDFKVACKNDEVKSLANSVTVSYRGVRCKVVSVYDLILKKLEWGDISDVKALLISYEDINIEKLLMYAKKRNVYSKLKAILEEIKSE